VAFDLANDADLVRTPFVERMRAKLVVAAEAIDSGAALAKLEQWIVATNAR